MKGKRDQMKRKGFRTELKDTYAEALESYRAGKRPKWGVSSWVDSVPWISFAGALPIPALLGREIPLIELGVYMGIVFPLTFELYSIHHRIALFLAHAKGSIFLTEPCNLPFRSWRFFQGNYSLALFPAAASVAFFVAGMPCLAWSVGWLAVMVWAARRKGEELLRALEDAEVIPLSEDNPEVASDREDSQVDGLEASDRKQQE